MAKSDQPTPLEQHIEKIVLGVCLLIFLIALLVWGVSSPRTVDLGGREVDLDKTDEIIRDEALKKEKKALKEEPEEYPDLEYAQNAKEMLTDPLADAPIGAWDRIALAMPSAPPMEDPEFKPYRYIEGVVEGPVDLPTVAGLERVTAPPPPPQIHIELELLKHATELPEVFAAHGALVFSYLETLEGWLEVVKRTTIEPVFIPVAVEVERQERLPDGSWGHKGRPDESMKVSLITMDKEGKVLRAADLVKEVPEYDGSESSAKEIRRAFSSLKRASDQEEVVQPAYGDIYSAKARDFVSWLIHAPPIAWSQAVGETTVRVRSDTRRDRDIVPELREPPPDAIRPKYRVPPEGIAPDDELRPEDLIRPSDRTGVRPWERRPGETRRRPGKTRPIGRPAPETGEQDLRIPRIRPLKEQMADGQLLVWFHDIRLRPRMEYRYRCRLVLVNPLLGYDAQVKDEADAGQRFMRTPWSPWSEGTAVPEVMAIALTGSSPLQKKAIITVFRRTLGQTVSARFSLTRGEAIGSEKRAQIDLPHTGTTESRRVDFGTGAVIVSLDFDKLVTKGNLPRETKTVEMLYLDEKGNLKRTIKVNDMDRDSPEYKRYLELKTQAGN